MKGTPRAAIIAAASLNCDTRPLKYTMRICTIVGVVKDYGSTRTKMAPFLAKNRQDVNQTHTSNMTLPLQLELI